VDLVQFHELSECIALSGVSVAENQEASMKETGARSQGCQSELLLILTGKDGIRWMSK
jgi:hypothetical protein